MQNQKELSPEESFVIIQGMIATARNKFAENGFHLMLWGVLVITCCLANYFLLADGFGNLSGLPWAIMPFIGVPVGIMYEKNRMSAKQVSTHADLHVKHIWLSFLAGLVLVIVFCSVSHISPVPFILIVTGMATFSTGRVLQFTPLMLGGIVFWGAALLCIKVTNQNQLLVHAAATFLGYIVPGMLLWKEHKAGSHV